MEEKQVDKKEKLFRLNIELKHLKKLTCRYKSMSDYCEPNYCICSKIGDIESEITNIKQNG